MGAGNELHAPAAGVDVDDDVGGGEEDGREVVGDLAGDGSFRVPGEGPVHVHAVEGREPGGGLRGGHVQRGDEDQPPRHLLWRHLAGEAHDRHLPLVFIPMVAAEAEDGRPFPAGDDRHRHHHVRPAAEVVRIGHLEKALLLARARQINGGMDHGKCAPIVYTPPQCRAFPGFAPPGGPSLVVGKPRGGFATPPKRIPR